MKLSVLDQSPIAKGTSPQQALQRTVALAQHTERLGYQRFWLAEHHNTVGLSSSSPEILVGHVASQTQRIRVGSGGVLLPHYSPYKVAENFRLLENLHPGRIDLGIGRAPGGNPLSSLALTDGERKDIGRFPSQVEDVRGFLTDNLPTGHPFEGVRATPAIESVPEMWLLGSSDGSARFASNLGLPLSFAHFINANGGAEIADFYRSRYEPSSLHPEPQVNVCIFVVCAETEEEAQKHAASLELWMIQVRQGKAEGIPAVEEAVNYQPTPFEAMQMKENRERIIVGDPQQVKAQIEDLAKAYQTDEVMLITNIHDFHARMTSYQLIADAFESGSD